MTEVQKSRIVALAQQAEWCLRDAAKVPQTFGARLRRDAGRYSAEAFSIAQEK